MIETRNPAAAATADRARYLSICVAAIDNPEGSKTSTVIQGLNLEFIRNFGAALSALGGALVEACDAGSIAIIRARLIQFRAVLVNPIQIFPELEALQGGAP